MEKIQIIFVLFHFYILFIPFLYRNAYKSYSNFHFGGFSDDYSMLFYD